MTDYLGSQSREGVLGVVSFTKPGARQFLDNYEQLFGHVPRSIVIQIRTDEIIAAQKAGDWPTIFSTMCTALDQLERAGADFAVIPANSIHYAIDQIQHTVRLPVLNMVRTAAVACGNRRWQNVLVLGVASTIRDGLYTSELERVGVSAKAPPETAIDKLDELIYAKLVPGNYTPDDLEAVQAIIEDAISVGQADGVLLACSELALAINADTVSLPFVDANVTLADAAHAAATNLSAADRK